MRLSLFVTCLGDTLFPAVGQATVRLLERLGHTVDFPMAQTCCGQMHYNSGYEPEATTLLRHFVTAFAGAEMVVVPSGSCAAMVREGYPRLAARSGDRGLAAAVAALAPRVHELSELLIDVLQTRDVGATYPHRVTYHPTCHSLRMLGVADRPLQLLRAVREIDLVELPGAQECCGFGGTFAVKNPDVSSAMLADKIGHIQATGAEVLCASDSSCLMHIAGALSRQRAGVRTVHLAEILAATEGLER